MQKNDLITVVIEDIGTNGEGIGKADGYTVFIKDAVIGDVIEAKIMKAKKNYGYAKLIKIITPSEYRVKNPVCPLARKCGGCQIQEMEYGRQLQFKEEKVRGNLMRIGGIPKEDLEEIMEPIIGMEHPFAYRNKAQFPFGSDKEGRTVTGFYAGRTHDIIANTDCALGVPVNKDILEIVLGFMKENHIRPYDEKTGSGLIRHVLIRYGFATKEIMVCIVANGRKIPNVSRLLQRLRELKGMTSITISPNTSRTNVIMHGEETVWDLYCGIGTISLFLAKQAKQVYGVEIVPQAVEDARSNARINGITNAKFFEGKAEEVLPDYYREYNEKNEEKRTCADVVVVDPPRKGCDEVLLRTIAEMGPEKIVYVSCDSATLARDVKYLCGKGYEVKRARAVDQFPHSVHVEVAMLLTRADT